MTVDYLYYQIVTFNLVTFDWLYIVNRVNMLRVLVPVNVNVISLYIYLACMYAYAIY